MAVDNDRQRIDGQASFLGGMNSDLSARLLDQDQVAWAVNATMRGGKIGPRPGFQERSLVWTEETHETNYNSSTAKFQGAGTFFDQNGTGYIYCSIGGRIFVIEPARNFRAAEITPSGDPNSNNPDVVTFAQAERWTIVQDNRSRTIILEGTSARRATGDEVRSGTVSRYVNGRLWTASGFDYRAGDLVGSSSGNPILQFKDAILKNEENTYLNGGGSFSVPVSSGPIRAMLPLHTLDTVLGDGELIVLTDNAGFATSVPTDRTQWADTTYPLQRNVLSSGCVGPFSAVNVNNDIFFRSRDGIRSLLTARRDFESPGNTPISAEIRRILERDTDHLLKHTSAIVFDNRLIHTAVGTKQTRGVTHEALAVMDFNPVSSLRGKAAPIWEGAWAGLQFLHLVSGTFSGEERAFAFILNDLTNEIELWEITKDQAYDSKDAGDPIPVSWYFETRGVNFSSEFELSKLNRMEAWMSGVEDDVAVTIRTRPDGGTQWETWNTHAHAHQKTICDQEADNFDSDGCLLEPVYQPGYRARVSIANPPGTSETETWPCKTKNFGYTFQFRVEVVGKANIELLRWFADIAPEPYHKECPPTTATETSDGECPLTEYPAIDLT